MLTLDPTTLFYWTLSDPPPENTKYIVASWVKTIPSNAKPTSRAPSQANTVKRGKVGTAGKQNRSTGAPARLRDSSRLQAASSVLTSSINITNPQVPGSQAANIKQDMVGIYTYFGGLSDCDETTGPERDAALAAPFKGKRRLNSEALVRIIEKKPKLTEDNKNFKNRDLQVPDGIDRHVWRRIFVPTFMMHVARQDNPFEHNIKVGCAAMQKIWDQVVGTKHYKIVHSSPVYQLTMQRVSDSWCSTMGSTAIAIVLAFCNAMPDLKDSDENRQKFAAEYLEHFRFVYEEAGDDVKKFRGVFRGAFVLQTFASHLTAVKGAEKIHGLTDSQPYGALAMATAAVERALELIALGTITVEMVRMAKGRAAGKASNQLTEFNETVWGARCSSYVKSAKKLSASRFDKIISLSAKYIMMKAKQSTEDEDDIEILDDDSNSTRADLPDNSSSSASEGDHN